MRLQTEMSGATSPPLAVAATAQAVTALREFLSFKLGAEEYGIDILNVQEIRSYEEPTRIANAPPFIKGVVNLRGVIVPIIDMRLKFNLAQVSYDSLAAAPVVNASAPSASHYQGPERRSRARAKNVVLPNFKATGGAASAPKKTGTNDEWTSF